MKEDLDEIFKGITSRIFHLILDTDSNEFQYGISNNVESIVSNLMNLSLFLSLNFETIKRGIEKRNIYNLYNKQSTFKDNLFATQDSILSNCKGFRYLYKQDNVNLNTAIERRIVYLVLDLKSLCELFNVNFDFIFRDKLNDKTLYK